MVLWKLLSTPEALKWCIGGLYESGTSFISMVSFVLALPVLFYNNYVVWEYKL